MSKAGDRAKEAAKQPGVYAIIIALSTMIGGIVECQSNEIELERLRVEAAQADENRVEVDKNLQENLQKAYSDLQDDVEDNNQRIRDLEKLLISTVVNSGIPTAAGGVEETAEAITEAVPDDEEEEGTEVFEWTPKTKEKRDKPKPKQILQFKEPEQKVYAPQRQLQQVQQQK